MGSLWNRSGTIERFGPDDLPARGAKAFFYQGGTTTPLTVFQDGGESSAFQFPVLADSNGRWPAVFVPYITSYDVQVRTAEDVQLSFIQLIPNPDPVSQTVVIPPEQRVQTGMMHAEFINATKVGYVRLNGRTIGNGTSLATERANNDTSDLFTYLWNNVTDALAPVSGGRGASAAADFGANKTLTLPDMRGATFVGLDDMGNTAAGAFTGLTFNSGTAILPSSGIGFNSQSIGTNNMPAHVHTGTTSTAGAHTHSASFSGNTTDQNVDHSHTFSGTTSGQSADHSHTVQALAGGSPPQITGGGSIGPSTNQTITSSGTSNDHTHNYSGTTSGVNTGHSHGFSFSIGTSSNGDHSHGFTTSSVGSGLPFNNMLLSRLVTWYIKL